MVSCAFAPAPAPRRVSIDLLGIKKRVFSRVAAGLAIRGPPPAEREAHDRIAMTPGGSQSPKSRGSTPTVALMGRWWTRHRPKRPAGINPGFSFFRRRARSELEEDVAGSTSRAPYADSASALPHLAVLLVMVAVACWASLSGEAVGIECPGLRHDQISRVVALTPLCWREVRSSCHRAHPFCNVQG